MTNRERQEKLKELFNHKAELEALFKDTIRNNVPPGIPDKQRREYLDKIQELLGRVDIALRQIEAESKAEDRSHLRASTLGTRGTAKKSDDYSAASNRSYVRASTLGIKSRR